MNPHRQLLADYAESGSEEAFSELVNAYIGFVHGSALRLVHGNSQLAEDITQTVFTDLARKSKSLAPEVMIGGWLHRRTCYAASTALRSERRRIAREKESYEMNALNSENPDEALAGVAPVLDEAINQLGNDDRNAIMLRFFEQWNLRAIGETMGASESAAQKRVQRALEKLRGLLARRGVVMPAAGLALAMTAASASAAPAGLAATVSTAALSGAHAGSSLAGTILKIMAMTKLKAATIAAAVALVAVGTVTTTVVIFDRDPVYTPPPGRPNPQKILYEASADTGAGRFKQAQAKFIWYRENALKYDKSQKGVRDSFALSYWCELAQKYPPAKKKLMALREEAMKDVENPKGDAKLAQRGYIIASMINDGFKEADRNIEMFKWLDKHNHEAATFLYSLVEMQLISAGEFKLCDAYMNADKSYAQIVGMYRQTKKFATKKNAQLRDFADKSFSNQTARLVAVLVINNHVTDAERIADNASKELKTPEFAALLADAKDGKVPAAWPPGAPN